MTRPLLTAQWEDLVLLNFECPEHLLAPLVPDGTELDPWRGSHLVSLVGFRFLDTAVKGIPFPGHRSFNEVNLRFYVRRRTPAGELRRAVVFIKELVPSRVIATAARLLYNEPYEVARIEHDVVLDVASGGRASYRWKHTGSDHHLWAEANGAAQELEGGSEAEFVTEHYWGYNRQRDGSTLEYRVEHPTWLVWEASVSAYESPASDDLFGPELSAVLRGPARSCHLASGSGVVVFRGKTIDAF